VIRVSVGGIDRHTLDSAGVTITRTYNERAKASLAFATGFTPTILQEIIIYANDGITAQFGGYIHEIDAGRLHNEGGLVHVVECVDWWAALDWTLVTGGYVGANINIASSNVGNPGTINTATAHNFTTGDVVLIQDHTGVPNTFYTVTVVDADTFTIPINIPGAAAVGYCARSMNLTLQRILSDLVVHFLNTPYAITLDAAQDVGPTGTHVGLQWKNKSASDVIRDLSALSGLATGAGWVASISPTKVLRMVNPNLGTPSAPYAITDASERNTRIKWKKSAGEYGSNIVLKCGSEKAAEVTQTVTLTAAHTSLGYLDVFAPSTPTGGVTCKLNSVSKTIGITGAEFIWTWNGGANLVGRVTVGSISPIPSIGDVFAITFTAQYPFYVSVDNLSSPKVTRFFEFGDITDPIAANVMLASLAAKHGVIPYEIEFDTVEHGFEPGQIISIVLTDLALNVTGFILEVQATGQEGRWVYTVKVNTGAVTGSALDTFRGFTASGGGGSTFSGGVNTSVVLTGSLSISLGGATEQAQTPNSGTYVRVVNAIPFVSPAAMSAVIRAELWGQSGVQVTARLRDIDTGVTVATSSGVTSTTPSLTTFYTTTALVAGRRYELQITSNNTGAEIYGIGSIQSL